MKSILITILVTVSILSFNIKNVFGIDDNLIKDETSQVKNYIDQAKNLIQVDTKGVDTSIPTIRGLFSKGNLSKEDIYGVLKTVAVFAINIFLTMVQTIGAVLRGLLFFIR